MTIDEIQKCTEFQVFDRKSIRIDPKSLAVTIIAMANADGGTIAIGIEDDGVITGIDDYRAHVNELLRVPYDFCVPSVKTHAETINATDKDGKPNHILLLHIAQSEKVHANTADEVFYRVGDKSKKLNFEARSQLVCAKGERYYEDAAVKNSTIEDIDIQLVENYLKRIDYTKGPDKYLRENGFVVKTEDYKGREMEAMSGAAILLFGKNPQFFFQRARARVIRYEGKDEKVGREMNVIKDVIFKGAILEISDKVIDFVRTQIKEHTYLGPKGLFVTDLQYPEFCWKELIVNAICHRDYSVLGTDIQIKIFDDHMTVESPGIFPGMVRPNNMREIHFSRNPKIAEYMHAYDLVKEFGEGIDRMYRELEESGNPEPKFQSVEFMVKATIWQKTGFAKNNTDPKREDETSDDPINDPINDPKDLSHKLTERQGLILNLISKECRNDDPISDTNKHKVTYSSIASFLNVSVPTIKREFILLRNLGIIQHIGSKKDGCWILVKKDSHD